MRDVRFLFDVSFFRLRRCHGFVQGLDPLGVEARCPRHLPQSRLVCESFGCESTYETDEHIPFGFIHPPAGRTAPLRDHHAPALALRPCSPVVHHS
ncbi:hypothetical protein GCM10010319_28470 [Streptomyces blastmyceticus]|uniref:Uncharacterized protein n=1 Tax=Streptomyces blastmyceticus TaxID=68180 RepID=A0ABP3GMN5_9ACTN